ncbi:hypothetical protein HPB51_014771 [Rhipicephalus microplus]|uniref:peptidylprolyl isomerase n=1 Tax=Rhipicephalus microplus TaxID=6941 RepID=A0A9J6DNY9_RHIMP|nr:hypothetical protein HPB51_014771 [Rhipicephalus microplus]
MDALSPGCCRGSQTLLRYPVVYTSTILVRKKQKKTVLLTLLASGCLVMHEEQNNHRRQQRWWVRFALQDRNKLGHANSKFGHLFHEIRRRSRHRIIVHGSGHRVTPHAKVHFHCTTIAQSEYTERIDCSVMRNSPFRCYVKQAGVPGLQIALKSMRVGEQCQVRVSPEYGYGDVGCGHRIPPGAVLYFEVTLLNCVQTHSDCVMSSTEECSRLPFSELYKICSVKYRNANKFLAAQNYVDAERGYSVVEKQLKSAPEPAPDEQRYQRRELLLKLYHKLAYCRLKVHNPKMAVESCRHILRLDPSDPRALYRCAVGLRQLGEYEEAARMQQHAFALKPHSKHIINELVLLGDYVSMKPVRDKHVHRTDKRSSSCTEGPNSHRQENGSDLGISKKWMLQY